MSSAKCIVVTGARGYIGGLLARRLGEAGHCLRLVSRSTDGPMQSATGAEYVVADLREENAWTGLMERADAIVHLSSRTDLRAAEADPVGDEELNIEPVRALVRAAENRTSLVRVVYASTATIYGVNPALPVDERALDKPVSVYDRHKLACEEILCEANNRQIFRACSLRLANVYGYGVTSVNSNRGILNAMMRRALNSEPLTLYGGGPYIRDFIHVQDVVRALEAACVSNEVCDGSRYVIASGRGHSLANVYSLIAQKTEKQTGKPVEIRSVPEPADLLSIERRNFIGNPALFAGRAGWRPAMNLEDGIHDFLIRSQIP